MPAFFVPNDPVPAVAPPVGSLLAIPSPDAGADVFGALDVRATMTGLPTCARVELYLDDSKQGEAMSQIGRNRYIQNVQTSYFPDGKHRFAVVARDDKGQILATTSREVFFRNVGNVHVMSALPTIEGDAFEIALRINALRVRLGAESFVLTDRAGAGPVRPLAVSIEYRGDEINGIPVATLTARLPTGQKIGQRASDPDHEIVLTLKDNAGATSTWTSFAWAPPRE